MVLRIFTYLDKLFSIVQPQKLMFMAVDGEEIVFSLLFVSVGERREEREREREREKERKRERKRQRDRGRERERVSER